MNSRDGAAAADTDMLRSAVVQQGLHIAELEAAVMRLERQLADARADLTELVSRLDSAETPQHQEK